MAVYHHFSSFRGVEVILPVCILWSNDGNDGILHFQGMVWVSSLTSDRKTHHGNKNDYMVAPKV